MICSHIADLLQLIIRLAVLSYEGLWIADYLIGCMQLERGSKISMGISNLLSQYLEFLDRNISVLLVYCNKSIPLLLGLWVLKHKIQSTKEEKRSLLLHMQVPVQTSECAPVCLTKDQRWIQLVSVFSLSPSCILTITTEQC